MQRGRCEQEWAGKAPSREIVKPAPTVPTATQTQPGGQNNGIFEGGFEQDVANLSIDNPAPLPPQTSTTPASGPPRYVIPGRRTPGTQVPTTSDPSPSFLESRSDTGVRRGVAASSWHTGTRPAYDNFTAGEILHAQYVVPYVGSLGRTQGYILGPGKEKNEHIYSTFRYFIVLCVFADDKMILLPMFTHTRQGITIKKYKENWMAVRPDDQVDPPNDSPYPPLRTINFRHSEDSSYVHLTQPIPAEQLNIHVSRRGRITPESYALMADTFIERVNSGLGKVTPQVVAALDQAAGGAKPEEAAGTTSGAAVGNSRDKDTGEAGHAEAEQRSGDMEHDGSFAKAYLKGTER